MSALAAMQAGMSAWLLRGEPGVADLVRDTDRSDRLRIYADAYRLRLLEVIGNDFPLTKRGIGDGAFAALALAYVDAHPSNTPSLRHVGRHFGDWLEARSDAPRGTHELARFEWLQGECFDAIDASALGVETLAAWPADAWPGLQLQLHPAARLLSTRRLRLRGGTPALATRDIRIDWLLWRQGLDVHWRTLETDEAEALRAIGDGASFAALCERLAFHHGESAALRAAALLKRWLADGVLATPEPID